MKVSEIRILTNVLNATRENNFFNSLKKSTNSNYIQMFHPVSHLFFSKSVYIFYSINVHSTLFIQFPHIYDHPHLNLQPLTKQGITNKLQVPSKQWHNFNKRIHVKYKPLQQ